MSPRQVRLARCVMVLVLTAGCTYAARLYDTQAGIVIPAKFKWSGSGQGAVEITLPSGELCKGEYVTVPDDSLTWGSIFATSGTGTATASGYTVTTQGKQRGAAIATGDRGTVIECEYVTSAEAPTGYGACRDNRGKVYRLFFGGR